MNHEKHADQFRFRKVIRFGTKRTEGNEREGKQRLAAEFKARGGIGHEHRASLA